MNTPTDIAELRRLHEAATPGDWALAWEDGKTGVLASMIGKLVAIIGNPDPSDGYEPTRKANGEFMAVAHNALPALLDELEVAREALSQIYWKSIEDRGDSTINDIAGDALKGNTSPLNARDRHTKLIGAAEELERLAKVNQHRMLDCNDLIERAAQLRREAGKK